MKVLGISCSPRKGGNTEIMMDIAMASVVENGAEAELITVRDRTLTPCDGCFYCVRHKRCRIKDDMQEIYEKIFDADAMIWGTPVYFFDVTAQAKIIIDRLFHFYMNMMLTNKVAGVISVASSLGHQPVWNLFNTFFSINHMFFADFVYGYAPKKKGAIRKDKHAIKSAKELGKQIVLLVEKQYRYPQEYDLPIYRHVHEKLNIHMSPAMGRFD